MKNMGRGNKSGLLLLLGASAVLGTVTLIDKNRPQRQAQIVKQENVADKSELEKLQREIYQKEDGTYWIKLSHPSGIKSYRISSCDEEYGVSFSEVFTHIDDQIQLKLCKNSMLYVTDGKSLVYPIELGFE